jgi:hypothetical protein
MAFDILQSVIVALVVAVVSLSVVLRVMGRRMNSNHNPGMQSVHDMLVKHMVQSDSTHQQILETLRRIEDKLP